VLQISASLGALIFGILQDRIGSRFAIQLSLFLWILVCVGSFLRPGILLFYLVGNIAGLAMGSAQSAGRALVGSFSPAERSGEFFGFWGLFWKLSGTVGPPLFGLASFYIGMRYATLLTGLFFVVGIAGMFFIDEEQGKRAAVTTET